MLQGRLMDSINVEKYFSSRKVLRSEGKVYYRVYTTKGTSSPILRRSEEVRVKLCDMKT